MNLKQIDERLALFPEYLRYKLNHLKQLPADVMHHFITTGVMYLNFDRPMTFDQWLFQSGHEDLIYYPFAAEFEGIQWRVAKHKGSRYFFMDGRDKKTDIPLYKENNDWLDKHPDPMVSVILETARIAGEGMKYISGIDPYDKSND